MCAACHAFNPDYCVCTARAHCSAVHPPKGDLECQRGTKTRSGWDGERYLYPEKQDDHFFEWSDLIAALLNAKTAAAGGTVAKRRFNMLELGAGWAKWIVDAAALARQLKFEPGYVAAVGIEAQPDHCKMAEEHMAANDAASKGASMMCAAVGAEDGELEFPIDNSGGAFKGAGKFGYGAQMILDGKRWGDVRKVKAIGICSLVKLAAFGGAPIDFVSLDVQSFEHAILNEDAVSCMDSMVRLVHISLHRVEANDARPAEIRTIKIKPFLRIPRICSRALMGCFAPLQH